MCETHAGLSAGTPPASGHELRYIATDCLSLLFMGIATLQPTTARSSTSGPLLGFCRPLVLLLCILSAGAATASLNPRQGATPAASSSASSTERCDHHAHHRGYSRDRSGRKMSGVSMDGGPRDIDTVHSSEDDLHRSPQITALDREARCYVPTSSYRLLLCRPSFSPHEPSGCICAKA